MGWRRCIRGDTLKVQATSHEELLAKIDEVLHNRRKLTFLWPDFSLYATIKLDERVQITPYLVIVEAGQPAPLYKRWYKTLALLDQEEPYDLSKFTVERK
jgi:hypothetical protein